MADGLVVAPGVERDRGELRARRVEVRRRCQCALQGLAARSGAPPGERDAPEREMSEGCAGILAQRAACGDLGAVEIPGLDERERPARGVFTRFPARPGGKAPEEAA